MNPILATVVAIASGLAALGLAVWLLYPAIHALFAATLRSLT